MVPPLARMNLMASTKPPQAANIIAVLRRSSKSFMLPPFARMNAMATTEPPRAANIMTVAPSLSLSDKQSNWVCQTLPLIKRDLTYKRTRMADGIAQDGNVNRPQVPDLNASGVAWALKEVAYDVACIPREWCAALWTRKRRVMCDRFEAESRPDAGAQAT